MDDSSNCDIGCDGESAAMIPNQKTLTIHLPSSSNIDVSSMVSMKEDCESPMSSWASDPETDISSVTSCHVIMPEESLQDVDLEGNYENQFVGVENNDDGFLWEMDNRSYEDLLKKFIEKEEDLRVSNLKLQLSEQEITGLAIQVEVLEIQIDDACQKLELKEDELCEQKKLLGKQISKLKIQNLNSVDQFADARGELNLKKRELVNVRKELELKEKELNEQKKLSEEEIFKLKNQIKENENQLDNVQKELELKEKELNEQKELSEEEIFKLRKQVKESENRLDNVWDELNLKTEKLQKQTVELDTYIPESVYKITNLMEQLEEAHKKLEISTDEIATLQKELGSKSSMIRRLQCEIKEEKKKMHSTLFDLQATYVCEQEKMSSDIASLSKQKKQLTSKLEACESRNKELEQKVMRNEAENLTHLQEIRNLRTKLGQRMNDVEAANKKSARVMIQIDEANVQIDKLKAEICSRDDEISHLKKYINDVNTSRIELVLNYRAKLNEENKLKLKVEELEKEVKKQNGVILDMAKEKKEAIRQLCNSLEHYRSGYNERIRALNGL
ncbi:protein NETWORKED 4B-like [Vicia villosa]|uniref:protein NETWORKED 4B-like n=1 Tax=Vicia villosa TaxID=3911 RepID=UPI00273C5F42|nr:protein NETWORKED 4B-like [Vicia villosa]